MARAGRAPADASVRFGVVGAGSLGFHHLRIARELKGVDLVGFYDVRPERSREVSQALGVRAFEGYEALLAGVDALIVATPTRTHAEVSEVALGRRIHVFIEKPIAATLEEADRILAAADSGVKVQVGHVERFNTAVLGARPYLERPLFIESHRLARFSERGADVAVVLDLMIHDVDLVASLVGSPIEDIQATGVPVLTDSVDIANARIRFRGGAIANLTASRVSTDPMRKIRIFQPSGYLSLDLASGTGEFLRLRRELPALAGLPGWGGVRAAADLPPTERPADLAALVERIPLRAQPVEPLRRELESFRDAILEGSPPVVGPREGRNALATALAIEERIMAHVAHTSTS